MNLSKNSSREDIVNYIKSTPDDFLLSFQDETWAQSYINGAAKGAARKSPEYFLEHWAARFPQGIDLALFALKNENKYKIFANIFYV